MVYFSTYSNPINSTSDLRQIRYTSDLVLQLLDGLVAAVSGPLVCSSPAALGPLAIL